MNDIRGRFILILNELFKGNQSQMASKLGLTQGHISNIVNRGSKPSAELIAKTVELIGASAEWLLTGTGEMLRQTPSISSSNQGAGNKIEYNHIGIGNSVNANISDSSSQKTIYPTGKVEVADPDHTESALPNKDSEKQLLKAEIAHLRENMAIKDELIISLRETIELLRNKQK